MVFSPLRLKIAKLLSAPNFYFDQFCPAALHLLAFSNECMYVSCQTKIWMPEINWLACHEWQVTMVTNFPAIFSHFSIFGGNWLQQIGQGIGSPISWRRSRLSSVGKQFHADGHLEMSKSITGEESPIQLQLQTTSSCKNRLKWDLRGAK